MVIYWKKLKYYPLQQPRVNWEVDHDSDPSVKVDIPEFTWGEQPVEVMDWLSEVERVFEYLELPDNKWVNLVATKLNSSTSSWWQWVEATRIQSGKERI